jgi:hypothetical protein
LLNASSSGLTVTKAYFTNASTTGFSNTGYTWLSGVSTGNASSSGLTVSGLSTLGILNASGSTTLSSLTAGLVRSTAGGALFIGKASLTADVSGVLPIANGGLGFDASAVQKGDLITGTGAGTMGIQTVGANGLCLTASSTTASGVAWTSCAAAAGGIQNLNGLTATSQTFSTSSSGGLDLKIVSASSDHQFILQPAANYAIPLSASTTEWSTAYSWGNHASAGYLTSATAA